MLLKGNTEFLFKKKVSKIYLNLLICLVTYETETSVVVLEINRNAAKFRKKCFISFQDGHKNKFDYSVVFRSKLMLDKNVDIKFSEHNAFLE